MIYRERYSLNREYRVLEPEAIELLMSGLCDSEDKLLRLSTIHGFDAVSTVLTAFGDGFLQYSTASKNLGGLQSMLAFDRDSSKGSVVNCPDIAILQKGLSVRELLALSRKDDFLDILSGCLELNSGNVLNGFSPEVGRQMDDGSVLAGYLIGQSVSGGTSISTLVLPVREWKEFCYDMENGDSRLAVLKEYLLCE